jgi:hypothetical protein
MPPLIPRRMTGHLDGRFVVFLIGMRINSFWRVHRWLPAAMAMPRMLRELSAQPALGFLGAEAWFGRTTIMVQYWRSLDQLMEYAHAKDSQHLPAWREFHRRAAKTRAVGIWHETFIVEPGQYESVYFNMPRFGLAAAGDQLEATGSRERARDRIAANQPAAHAP